MKKLFVALWALSMAAGIQAANNTVTLTDFSLTGDLGGESAAFTLTAIAHVENSSGGTLSLLAGPVALTAFKPHEREHIRAAQNQFFLDFDRKGEFPIEVKFAAKVHPSEDGNEVEFAVAPSVLEPIVLRGLAADTQFQFAGAARPNRQGGDFISYLPADGMVKFSWKQVRPESEGKLFFSAEMLSQIAVSPGLMRQMALMDFKVMQGEVGKVSLRLRGAGEVTRVQGDQVLSWNVESISNSTDRRLVIQLNQPQKDNFSLQVQAQTPLDAFPQTADILQISPENATRFAGYIRLVNEGAVRLEVVQATGTSQISPEQFPETDATRAAFRGEGHQRFAYRFASTDFSLRIQADQILPEVSVSELLGYRVTETELTLDANLELDIREAPLRELLIAVPKNFAVAKLSAAGLADYYLTDNPNSPGAELRLVFSQPISDRQLIQLRLEHNQALAGQEWALPRLEVARAKSVRGFVGVGADAGFRLTAGRTKALTDIATAFYPEKSDGLQTAFRLNDNVWEAEIHVERLPQTVQASALHLFSIGEGIAYGSSVLNYVVSGAPVSSFRVALSNEYYNVEFTGKDLRNWQKTSNAYVVQLYTPVSGPYTLLATYERPFKAQGETLSFSGARPLDAQSEDGYTLVTSAYQFNVKPADVSPGLLALEPGEVPPEYRLFFDAPVLAAYRYTARPFDLKLALSPLAQGESLSQIVDRASLDTHISKEGQAITDIRYFLKNRGNPNFRLTMPDGAELWSVAVNNTPVVPVQDGKASLIPLPQSSDPNAVLQLDVKLASQSADAKQLRLTAPIADAPILLAQWKLDPDAGQRLVYQSGSVMPVGGTPDVSGFAQLARIFSGEDLAGPWKWLCAALALTAGAMAVWRRAARDGVYRGGAAAVFVLLVLAFICTAQLAAIAGTTVASTPTNLTLLAPVQQAGSALSLAVANAANTVTVKTIIGYAWPTLLALLVLALRPRFAIAAWMILAWAALRIPNGAALLFWVVFAFLAWQSARPVIAQLWRMPRSTPPVIAPPATALIIGGFLLLSLSANAMPNSVIHTVRVEDKFALGTAKIQWQAARGDTLPLLSEPAVLTRVVYPTRSLELLAGTAGAKYSQQILARSAGTFEIDLSYQIPISPDKSGSGFKLPVPYGLINQLTLTVANLDVDVTSAQAVSVRCDHANSNTVASLVLSPAETSIAWRPRSRDVRHERPIFYAEATQLFAPTAGVIEGTHIISIRPAQGELSALDLTIPHGMTVTDVTDANKGSLISVWRFDPDSGKLRVALNQAQSRPFTILVRSQASAGPLPFAQTVGLIAVENTAGEQIGMAGVATGTEVQLDEVTPHALSPINLEDFPGDALGALQAQMPDLVLHRAFRYSKATATLTMRAAAVQPDVRIETDDTLSLGEDRTVLADNFTANIMRAGIFELSFLMPDGFDVESISSPVLSQWTELKTEAGRVITLHLTGKTQGEQSFVLTLVGPGVKTAKSWKVPQVILREANKQRGSLLVVPEQGMRLQVARREGYSQLDPQKSGVKQKGVLGFRALQVPATLALDIEQVDPWIQVTSLQHAAVSDAQIKVTANLQYQIENTGLKSFRVLLPADAESVHFQGDQMTDFAQMPGAAKNGLQTWQVKLGRRVIGQYLLQASYQIVLPSGATKASLRSVEAADVNLQRGFVTLQSDPRLQVSIVSPPETLQPTEWQSIPRVLQKDLQTVAADFTYRLVEPSFDLSLKLQRHEAAKLLPARVNNITFHSVISDDGIMLTSTRLEIAPGDKRLLEVTLPPDAHFWFSFVNDSAAWPWREGEKILIPMERQTTGDKPVIVEFFHSCRAGKADARSLDLGLLAPKFDLPLENITWNLSMSDKWRVKHWNGSLQLEEQAVVPCLGTVDTEGYLQKESTLQQARTAEAEQFMALGNSSLEKGEPQEARRAFESAYGLSTEDAAFNEDARVQLHNVKLQQALIGLNARQSASAGDAGALGGKLRELRDRREMNYTQQDAKDIIDINTAEDNSAFMRLAEKLIRQQDAAVNNPAGIRASIPEQGRHFTFKRAVAIQPWADLNINLEATVTEKAPIRTRLLMLGAVIVLLTVFGPILRRILSPGAAI